MRIIHSGGTNSSLSKDDPGYKTDGFGSYFMLQLKDQVDSLLRQGKTICVSTAAKPDKTRYVERFLEVGINPDDFVILERGDDADWEAYNAVFLLGGNTKELHAWLKKTNFEIKRLRKCELLAGDSAGAYVLAAHTLLDYSTDGELVEIGEGFIPELNILVAAHVNNSHYHTPGLEQKLKEWCIENDVDYLGLRENEVHSLSL